MNLLSTTGRLNNFIMYNSSRTKTLFAILALLVVVLFTLDLMVGAVSISFVDVWRALFFGGGEGGGDVSETTVKIVRNIRLMKAVVAVVAGVALSVSGLQMQTLFRNPLAGPYTLGVSSGAGLGVALFILGNAGGVTLSSIGVAGAAWLGSALILLFLATIANRIKDIMVILILGIMFSSGVGAIVQVMQYFSGEERLKSFVVWTMGSLGDVTSPQLFILLPVVVVGVLLSISVVKALNLLMLGESYARSMGLDIRRSRRLIFISTTLLAGTVTAFCGPIGFVGLAVPHIARAIFKEANHIVLMPAVALTGAIVMLLCDIISKCFALPINTITALVGIPIVVWVVLRNKTIA